MGDIIRVFFDAIFFILVNVPLLSNVATSCVLLISIESRLGESDRKNFPGEILQSLSIGLLQKSFAFFVYRLLRMGFIMNVTIPSGGSVA
jgi:hypothetical protein